MRSVHFLQPSGPAPFVSREGCFISNLPMSAETPSTTARSRRRYMPGSARSKTIELGTLSEIEEDLYQNRKDVTDPCSTTTTRDDSFVGTIRRPSRGSVKAIARSLSEKYKAAAARHQEEQEERQEDQQPISAPLPPIKSRQYAEELGIQRSMSERRHFRERQPSDTYLHDWASHRPSASEFHPRPPSAISRHASVLGGPSLSRSASVAGRMLIYDPRTMSLVDPSMPNSSKLPEYPVPVWMPPPSQMYIPLGAPLMPYPQKPSSLLTEQSSACSEICCGGIAQLLWTIIAIILVGIIFTLILALFFI